MGLSADRTRLEIMKPLLANSPQRALGRRELKGQQHQFRMLDPLRRWSPRL